ncbi:SDR family NAD(P)-dependent oxidoreductase [Paenibacillus sp. UMB7766-LJ446]|uniref:SDR family NAD(P)-dependent oxidoreductase n=1 Tax=Paenibacillus sp. UMB7766-LJ446 TaxID=3046313 RepID=UPI00254CF604|nr:SDR family NAD(P)-dependent oxidoreductase [Paenibacillus sp. UMB7766-LJ446]MDK8193582.1 SDR family NAD(P)-dependent oxidoreductase [Paenibacillus sp. UMB7766-LJ446]
MKEGINVTQHITETTRMLSNKIAIVTGASRGAGKGIAIALGQAGAIVYVTGRSTAKTDSPYGGSIGETAELVTQAGGKGIPVLVDHADDEAVADLFARVKQDYGKLDILVNNASKVADPASGGFWEKPLNVADLITVGLRSHYVSSYHAAPLMIANGKGLIVNTGHYGAVSYYQGPAYGAQKAGGDKMAGDMAKELRPYNVAAVSIWMGGLDTERARAYFATLPEDRIPKQKRESPEFTGRVIAALYESDQRMTLSGRSLIGAELGAVLDVTDIDGSTPLSYRYTMGGPHELHSSLI